MIRLALLVSCLILCCSCTENSISKKQLASNTVNSPIDPLQELNKKCADGDDSICEKYAIELYSKEDFQSARELFDNLCRKGYGTSCRYMGKIFYDEFDYSKAYEYSNKACSINQDGETCYLKGKLLASGQGVTKNANEALQIFKKGCEQNNKESCRELFDMYWNGNGVKKSSSNAMKYAEKACKYGHTESCLIVGTVNIPLFTNDREAQKKSFNSYLKACELQDGRGCGFVAGFYLRGNVVAKDPQKTLEYAKKGCDLKDGRSCGLIAECYENGFGVNQDVNMANAYNIKGCELNDPKACDSIGLVYQKAQDYISANEAFSKACEGEIGGGCYELGVSYWGGLGVVQNINAAMDYFVKSCDLNSPEGCETLGMIYSQGIGVQGNISKAQSYYKKGCKLGSQSSCQAAQQSNRQYSVKPATTGSYKQNATRSANIQTVRPSYQYNMNYESATCTFAGSNGVFYKMCNCRTLTGYRFSITVKGFCPLSVQIDPTTGDVRY